MNFAAQLIYANYFGEGTSQPRELSEDEEHDPFWQRWDTVGHSDLQSTPGAASRVGSEPVAPPAQITNSSPAPFPAPHVSPPPPQQTLSSPSFQKAPVVRTLKKRQFQAAAPPLLPTPPLAVTPSPPAPPQPSRPAEAAAVAPKQTSTHGTPPLLKSKPPTEPPSRPPRQPLAVAMPLSLSPPQSLPLSPSPSEREALLPAFHTLVSFLLHLALSFILLFLPSEDQRLGPSKPGYSSLGGHYRKRLSGSNGSLGRRPTLICPERLKDFGEEEYLNGDVRTWETTVMGPPEVQLASPPKTSLKQDSECRPIPKPQPELLRFEDISTAALKIQSVLQKTPCTYSRLSKQYGLEIYLKKEHLHYTGSVKERGVLYLLSSLKQEEQRKGVIVATDCNFSMAVAYHAVELRIPVFVIMPVHSSPPRLRMYRDYGAMVISYGSTARDSQNHARHLATENGYLCLEEDDSAVYLAGLGTVGIEIYEQVPKLDAVIVPAGGQCGLLAGIATAVKHLNSRIAVIGVEPEDFPLLLQSLKTDTPIKDLYCSPNRKLYGDLLVHSMGTNSFQLAKKMVDKVITVREEDALVAMLRFQEYERSTVDTEGAMGLAAILAGQLPDLKGKRVAVVVSSANMEMELVRQCVERALVLDDRVSRFSVQLGDWPGDMAKLLDLLAREDVRLLDVCHRRHSDRTELFKAQVECVVETRDKTQNCQLRRMLSDRYPSLRWLDR